MSRLGTSIYYALECYCARAEVTWAFTACAKAHDFSVAVANDYTGARTVVHSWRARRRVACAPPPMKGVWCSGCHSPRINQGGVPEMGLIKGVGQGKGGSVSPAKPTHLPIHNVTRALKCRTLGGCRLQLALLAEPKNPLDSTMSTSSGFFVHTMKHCYATALYTTASHYTCAYKFTARVQSRA